MAPTRLHHGEGVRRLANTGRTATRVSEGYAFSGQEQRVVLTFDLDFGEMLAACGDQIVSVVLFRLRNTTSDFVIRRLEDVIAKSEADLSQVAVVVVEDSRRRVRKLPIGSEATPMVGALVGPAPRADYDERRTYRSVAVPFIEEFIPCDGC